jgi:hypothetical protein
MESAEVQRVFEALLKAGWAWQEGALVAPNGTMWLDGKDPWSGDLRSFHERMVGRVNRLRTNVDGLVGADAADVERAMLDTAGLVEVLGMLLSSR